MNITERLAQTTAKQKEVVDTANALLQRHGELTQEALKLEGEIRLLNAMLEEEKKP